jgi:LysM repeat protein
MTTATAVRPVPARARGAATAAATAHRTHLTRRGRALLLAALVVLLFAAFSLGRAATGAATAAGGVVPAVEQTTVQPGDTLWAVARRIAPDHDPRPVVEQIRRLNGLTSAELYAGQQLLLPVAA